MKATLMAACALLCPLLFLPACGAPVRTDLASYQADPSRFEDAQIIFTTTITELTSNPDAFYDRMVEVRGFPNEGPAPGDLYWGFILSDPEGASIRCYETNYRVRSWIMPVMAIRRAAQKGDDVIVLGRFEKGRRIELAAITYEGDTMDTDFLPPIPMGYYN